jgi:hypothetical protein
VIVVATLRPLAAPVASVDAAPPDPAPLFCLACGDMNGVDVLLNVLLFVPFGATLAVATRTWRRAAVTAASVSLLIELLQVSVVGGRDATISDLITNSAGGLIGAALASWHHALLRPTPVRARALALIAASAAIAIMAATAQLLQPSIPHMGLWGQWTPQRLQFEPYTGTLHAFDVDGFAIPYELVPAYEALRLAMLDGSTVARVRLTTGEPPSRLAVIARLGSRVQEVLLVGAIRDALVYRTRLTSRDWGLRTPALLVPHAFPAVGESVVVEAGVRERAWYARVESPRGVVSRELPFSVALFWNLILPFDLPLSPATRWLSALWLAGLVFPAAWWGGHAAAAGASLATRLAWWGGVMALLAAALVIVPHLARFAPAAPTEWLGLLAGGGAALLLSRVGARSPASPRH